MLIPEYFSTPCVKVERKHCQKSEQYLFCGELQKVDQIMFKFDKKNFLGSKVSGALLNWSGQGGIPESERG